MTGLHEAAKGCLDTPLRHQGRSRSGLDGSGLLARVLADCGRAVEDVTRYGINPLRGQLEANLLREFGPAISEADAQPGDIVAIDVAGAARYVGVLGDYPGSFVRGRLKSLDLGVRGDDESNRRRSR